MTNEQFLEAVQKIAYKTVVRPGITSGFQITPENFAHSVRHAMAALLEVYELTPKKRWDWCGSRPTKPGVYRVRGTLIGSESDFPLDEQFVHLGENVYHGFSFHWKNIVVPVHKVEGQWAGPLHRNKDGDWVEE